MTSEPDYDAAIGFALQRLREELPPALTYHNLWHTQEDVMPAVQRLARACRLTARQRQLLAVAAAYHDVGFIGHYDDHEQAGAEMAAAALPQFGFGPDAIACITSLVLATRLAAQPENLLQAVIADADLDVLGRNDFLARGQALWTEISTLQRAPSWPGWLQEQRAFLHRHRYYTAAARALRDEGKRQNIVLLEELLQQKVLPSAENGEGP